MRCSCLPLFHETASALGFELGVGAARGGRREGFTEQVLEGDRAGGVAIRAKEEGHRVGECVQGEVGPVFRKGPRLEPREGQAGTGVPAAEGSVVGGVPVQRRGLQGGREPSGGWVDLGGGAHYPQAGQVALVCEEEVKWGEAGLHSEDVNGSARKAVGGPPLDLMPEGHQLPCHMGSGLENVSTVAQDRK